jgi:hypothetical protein
MPTALATWQTHVISQCGHICKVLEHAQVCTTGISPLTWWIALFFIFNSAAHICGLRYLTSCAVAYGGHIYRLLECAQVCMINIDSVADPTGNRP